MPLNAFIFDVEGTLVDCVPQILDSWQRVLADAGHSVTRLELQRLSGMDGGDMLGRLLPEITSAEKKKLLDAEGRLYRRNYLTLFQPVPGVRELFIALKKAGSRVAIATTCKGDELKTYDRTLRVLELVDAVACGDDVAKGKPHPDLFYEALRTLGITKASSVMAVGDTPYDALAAKPLGMQVTGVLTGGFSREELTSAGCDAVTATVADLQEGLSA